MLLEYMPFRACEPVLKTILSVSSADRCWCQLITQLTTGSERSRAPPSAGGSECQEQPRHEEGEALRQRMLC